MDTVNDVKIETPLYIYKSENHYGTISFDVAYNRAYNVAIWAGLVLPRVENIGKVEGYREYFNILRLGAEYAERTKLRCEAELDPTLKPHYGCRVEAVDKFGDRRRFWVGKSTGWMPTFIELKKSNSSGGMSSMGPYTNIRVIKR